MESEDIQKPKNVNGSLYVLISKPVRDEQNIVNENTRLRIKVEKLDEE